MQDVIVQNFPFNIYQKNNREVKVSLVLNFFMLIYSYICNSFMYRSDPSHFLLAWSRPKTFFSYYFSKIQAVLQEIPQKTESQTNIEQYYISVSRIQVHSPCRSKPSWEEESPLFMHAVLGTPAAPFPNSHWTAMHFLLKLCSRYRLGYCSTSKRYAPSILPLQQSIPVVQ